MKIEETLAEIRNIANAALKGVSDEEISKQTGLSVFTVTMFRRAVGIKHTTRGVDIFEAQDKKVNWYDEANKPQFLFTIPKHRIEDLGMEWGTQYVFTGKITNRKGVIELYVKAKN